MRPCTGQKEADVSGHYWRHIDLDFTLPGLWLSSHILTPLLSPMMRTRPELEGGTEVQRLWVHPASEMISFKQPPLLFVFWKPGFVLLLVWFNAVGVPSVQWFSVSVSWPWLLSGKKKREFFRTGQFVCLWLIMNSADPGLSRADRALNLSSALALCLPGLSCPHFLTSSHPETQPSRAHD